MSNPTRTLADYLKLAGVVTTEPAKTAAAAPAAPAPTPAPAKTAAEGITPPSQPSRAEPAGGVTPRDDHTEPPKSNTGGDSGDAGDVTMKNAEAPVMYDPAIIKTAEQKALLEMGILIPDEKLAHQIYQSKVAEYQAAKTAEQRKIAAQMEDLGKMQLHGMWKESCAMQVAEGEATLQDVMKIASLVGCDYKDILARAEQIQKVAGQLAAATPHSAFFDDQLGSAARVSSSHVMQGAESNQNTTEFSPEATAGTRGPTQGLDEKLIRMTDTVTLPGNPGVNHGQKVDQGKGL